MSLHGAAKAFSSLFFLKVIKTSFPHMEIHSDAREIISTFYKGSGGKAPLKSYKGIDVY